MAANAEGVSARVRHYAVLVGQATRTLRHAYSAADKQTAAATLAVVVLTTFGASALWSIQKSDQDAALMRAAGRLDVVASLAAHESNVIMGLQTPSGEHLDRLGQSLPQISLTGGRIVYLADAQGIVTASTSADKAGDPFRLSDLFGQPDVTHLPGKDAFETVLKNGSPAIATIRALAAGHLAIVQPRREIVSETTFFDVGQPALALMSIAGLAGVGASLRYRRRAERAGRTCTRLTRQIDTSLAQGKCGLWDWDATRGRLHWSASMYELLGYEPRGEHLTAAEASAILRSDEGCVRGLMDGWAARNADHFEQTMLARNAGGHWVWLCVKGQAVSDPVDGSRHIIGFATDVTNERLEAEQRARDEVRLREAVEAISEAFVLWDADDRLVLCNSKFLGLHGVPAEMAVRGTQAQEIFAAGRQPLTEKQVAGGDALDPLKRTFETQLSDGRWLRVNERRTRDGGVVSVGTDVSELKWKEARLRARERQLKGSVRAAETEAQRFAAIAERNYEANLAKTEFLARMSHELRTPLNAIIGFSDLMRHEILGPLGCDRYSEYTRDIHASGLKLLDTIDGILQMSRIEKGQIRLVPEPVRIDAALRQAIDLVTPDFGKRIGAIQTDIVPTLATLQADPSAIRELLAQLLRNALRYSSDEDPIRIRVRPAGSAMNIYIEDSGIGIPSDVLPRLGRPFEQVEAEYSRADGGSGLGLAIARGLTEMHGGRLKIRSQIGVGTIVLVHLPLVQPAANDLGHEPRPGILQRPHLIAAE